MTQPKERPIIMQGESVRAILSGTKTQTRRVVKLPRWSTQLWSEVDIDSCAVESGDDLPLAISRVSGCQSAIHCPYGQPGDRLWVRESWRTAESLDAKTPAQIGAMALAADYDRPWAPLEYQDGTRRDWDAEGEGRDKAGKKRSPLHMPRWACRLVLEVTAVRVERLQQITEEDAIAEHVKTWDIPSAASFGYLWNRINGTRKGAAWADNPWVWVVEFRRVKL